MVGAHERDVVHVFCTEDEWLNLGKLHFPKVQGGHRRDQHKQVTGIEVTNLRQYEEVPYTSQTRRRLTGESFVTGRRSRGGTHKPNVADQHSC